MKKKYNLINKSWAFNKQVSKVFDKHVRQSIPFYEVFQKDIAKYSEWFLKDGATIYDLGCSTGQTIKFISELNIDTKIKFHAIDNSVSMLKVAKKNLKKIKNKNFSIKFTLGDVNKIKFEKTNLIYSILLMPFLTKKKQIDLLKKSFKSLESGGAFICINKIRSNNSFIQDIFNELYFDFKKNQNLSEKDILKKAKSLRSVMTINTQEEETKTLKKIGFKHVEIFFKYLNFVGIIAIK